MREVIHHWWLLGLRAGLALLLAFTIFLLQAWAKFALLDTVTIPFVIVALSAYGILDSLLVFYLGLQFPRHVPARPIGLTQGVSGVALGIVMLTVFFRPAELRWFVYIVTVQAIAMGIFELLAGLRFTSHVREEWSCFAAGTAALAFAIWLHTGYDGTTRHALDWFLGYALLLSASMAWFSYRLFLMNRHQHHAHSKAHATIGAGSG